MQRGCGYLLGTQFFISVKMFAFQISQVNLLLNLLSVITAGWETVKFLKCVLVSPYSVPFISFRRMKNETWFHLEHTSF